MKNLNPMLAVAAALLLAAPTYGQSPAPAAADAGPATAHASSLTLPVGWEVTQLFNVQPTLSVPASMVVGPNGDLFFTETVGAGCNVNSATMIYRVAMNNNVPVQPVTIVPYTTVPIDAHELVFDPVTNALYAAGTCDQTGSVYRITASGVPELLNLATPLNDPDGLAIGVLPSKAGPQLFVTTQDGLFVFDLLVGPTTVLTQISVDLTNTPATGLGNWGFPVFDANSATLLATNVGRPVTRNTVELTFSGPTAAIATVVGPDNVHPMCLDHQGVRWFRQGNEIGFINPGNLFVPVVGSSGSFSRMADATGGNFFYVDIITGDVSRLDRPMRIDALTVSTAAGGFIPIELNAPAPRGNEAYLVVCGVSGASPGTPWGSTICPINADVITQVALWLAVNNNPATTNWSGFLDANGHATGEMRFYPGTIPSGVTFNLAFIAGNPEYTSNTVSIHVLP